MDDLFAPEQRHATWPSVELHRLLSGAIRYEQASPSVQSWARLAIYDGACELCSIDTPEGRRAALQKIPPTLAPLVEQEVKRIWKTERARILRGRGL